jgi:anaerobic selenocysteine-containing dehydrogenase
MCRLGEALNEVDSPPIQSLFVYSSNPAAIAPESAKVIKGLEREDLFTVVHEVVYTDTTDYADYILPAPSFIETGDLFGSYGQYYIQMSEPAIKPIGESISNHEMFIRLAEKMGLKDASLTDSHETVVNDLLKNRLDGKNHPNFKELSDLKGHRIGPKRKENPFQNGFFTPSGKIEFYSESMEKDGKDPLPAHVPLIEGSETEVLIKKYPLQLILPPAHNFLNSSLGDVKNCIIGEGKPSLLIHPEDAKLRGVEEGDLVRVFNDRGEIFRYAKLGNRSLRGVAVSEGAWWAKLSPGGKGVNQISSERLADMGKGATFHSNLVEVERAESTLDQEINSKVESKMI